MLRSPFLPIGRAAETAGEIELLHALPLCHKVCGHRGSRDRHTIIPTFTAVECRARRPARSPVVVPFGISI